MGFLRRPGSSRGKNSADSSVGLGGPFSVRTMQHARSGRAQGLALGGLALLILGVGAFLFLQGPSSPEQPEPDGTQPEAPVQPDPGALVIDRTPGREPARDPDRVEVPATPGGTSGGEGALGAAVLGQIVNESGTPVPGAKVWVTTRFRFGDEMPLQPVVEDPRFLQITDARGNFRFERLVAGQDMDLWAFHPDYAPRSGVAFAALPAETQELPPIVLSAGIVVSGVVQDTGGNPILAQVELGLQDRSNFRSGTLEEQREQDQRLGRLLMKETDERGHFRFANVSEGAIWSLRASAAGYASAEIQAIFVQPGQTLPEQVLVLDTEHVITGVVLNDERTPVGGALITVSRTQPRPVFTATGRSADDGSFTIRGLPQGMYGLAAMADGYGAGRVPRVEVDAAPVEVVMPKKGGVSGRVTNAAGQPLAAYSLELMRTRRNSTQYGATELTWQIADPSGNYKLEGLDAGTYVLLVRAPGNCPTYSPGFHVQRDVVLGIDVQMRRGGTIVGVVTGGDGQGLAGAAVSLHGPGYQPPTNEGFFGLGETDPDNVPPVMARTDGSGRFVLENAEPGNMKLYVEHAKHLPELVSVNVPDGGTAEAGSIRLYAGGSIFGVAVDENGAVLSGGTVNLVYQEGTGLFSRDALLDARGRFRFDGLRAGNYELIAFAANPNELWFPPEADKQRVYVTEGKETEVRLTSHRQ